MSIELHIFISDSRVPTRDEWQRQIEQLAFPTALDTTLDVRHDTGFSPTIFEGRATGFEFFLEPAVDVLANYEHIAEKVGGRDLCATFRWGGDLAECGAAISAAAALTKMADGVYFYPDDDVLYSADEAVNATVKELAELKDLPKRN